MLNIKVPYSTGYKQIKLDDARVNGILNSAAHRLEIRRSQEELIWDALNHPIHSLKLRDIAKNTRTVLIITSDHTRPVPSKITLPILLQEVRSLNCDVEIRILIATGFHRQSTHEEMIDKFGKDIVENENIINHDCLKNENMVFKGLLQSG